MYDNVLRGLPKVYPLTGEPIPVSVAEEYLDAAITQIEMELGCNLSECIHYQIEDAIEGWDTNNAGGISLRKWPATSVIQFSIKYPNATTLTPIQTFAVPPTWISLKRNKINLTPGYGQITSTYDNTLYGSASGFLPYGLAVRNLNGAYTPNVLEVVYRAGFDHDRLPSSVRALIIAWASYYMALDIWPILFSVGSVSDSLDGVSQSATNIIPQALVARLNSLDLKRKELAASFKKAFGRTFSFTRFGS